MNRLESAFRAVMLEIGLADLAAAAKRIGISQPQLSRILSGKIGLSEKTLRQVVAGLSDDPVHQFAILRAHLFDEAETSTFPLGLLTISMKGDIPPEVTFADVPDSLQKQLRLIADEIKNGDDGLAGSIGWIAGMVEEHRATYPDSKDKLSLVAEPETSRGPIPVNPVSKAIRQAREQEQGTAAPDAKTTAHATPPRNNPAGSPASK